MVVNISEEFKEALNLLQKNIVPCTQSDNVLLIFDNETKERIYMDAMKEHHHCTIDRIPITIEELLTTDKLSKIKYKRYKFVLNEEFNELPYIRG